MEKACSIEDQLGKIACQPLAFFFMLVVLISKVSPHPLESRDVKAKDLPLCQLAFNKHFQAHVSNKAVEGGLLEEKFIGTVDELTCSPILLPVRSELLRNEPLFLSH